MNIIYTVAVTLSLLAFCLENKAFLVPWLCDICVKTVDCVCNICMQFFKTAIDIADYHQRKKDARNRAREAATSKEFEKKAGTLSNAMCEMAKAGVPAETMTEFVRSSIGDQSKQDKHALSKIFLEMLKAAISAILKKLG